MAEEISMHFHVADCCHKPVIGICTSQLDLFNPHVDCHDHVDVRVIMALDMRHYRAGTQLCSGETLLVLAK